jgi:electron transfer flavoprotein alpha subunit
MKHLVIAEHIHGAIAPATLSAITAATAVGGEIHLLLAGADFPVNIAGVTKVRVCADACYKELSAENVDALVVSIAKDYTHLWVGASSFGKETMPRVAAELDMGQISDIVKVVSADTFVRPIYAGNALCTVQSSDAIKIITVRASAFGRAATGAAVPAEPVASTGETNLSRFVSREEQKSDRPDLGSARIVVSGGRGVGSKENFAIIEKLADKLGAAIGASRAAVDAGYIANDKQVGQTGKIVAPDLYIAIGISGAIQHLAGMMGAKTIVAINKDENAPIFGVADYGLVGDLFAILPELDASL